LFADRANEAVETYEAVAALNANDAVLAMLAEEAVTA
jgi:hypothetical protein